MDACTLLIKTICISPPVVSSSPWPSKVNVNIQAGLSAPAGTSSQTLPSTLDEDAASMLGLQGPWLFSSVSSSGGNHQTTVFPSCVHPQRSGQVVVNFRDVEVDSSESGVVSLAFCPAVAVELAADPGMCIVESAPLLVTTTPAATAELSSLFDSMKRLVAEDQHMQAQQMLCGTAVVGPEDARSSSADSGSAVCSGPLPAAALDSCVFCSIGGATAAGVDLMRITWRDNFLLLLLDIQSVLAYAASVSCSNSSSNRIVNNSSASKLIARACLPAAPSLNAASRILVGVLKYLALHGCWCCVSNLLAEAFKSGLLACTGVLATQQLTDMHRELQLPGPVDSAAATAASLILSLASVTDPADDFQGAPAATPALSRSNRRTVPAAAPAARAPVTQLWWEDSHQAPVVHCRTLSASSSSSRNGSYSAPSALFTAFLVLLAVLPLICFVPGGLAYAAHVGSSNVQLLLVVVQPLLPASLKVAACVCCTLLSALATGVACGSVGYHCLLAHR